MKLVILPEDPCAVEENFYVVQEIAENNGKQKWRSFAGGSTKNFDEFAVNSKLLAQEFPDVFSSHTVKIRNGLLNGIEADVGIRAGQVGSPHARIDGKLFPLQRLDTGEASKRKELFAIFQVKEASHRAEADAGPHHQTQL